MHCLYVRLNTTMYPMCERAANALMRLCICPGFSELSMLAYKQIVGIWSKYFFLRLRPEEEAISCLKKKPILVRYQSIFTLINEKSTEGL